MKKLALLLLGLILGFLLCYFFFCGVNGMEEGEDAPPPKPPQGTIKAADMIKLDAAYNERYKTINQNLGIVDNRSTWYSLEQMQQFLDYSEYQASQGKYPMDGVRIYLGVNDETANGGKGYTTMFLVPTSSKVPITNDSTTQKSKGSMLNFNFALQTGGGDIPGAPGMDYGQNGNPPNSNYPQN